jgi:hypothetical protein
VHISEENVVVIGSTLQGVEQKQKGKGEQKGKQKRQLKGARKSFKSMKRMWSESAALLRKGKIRFREAGGKKEGERGN